MPKINVLPKQVSELIAAGEVVERPASVIKELVENSIDAGADAVTVEIQHGGIKYIRVTDNGCGIAKDDVPLAFMRHATSKIKSGTDLDSIATLGFRGEALAAVSSVARVELFTKTADAQIGTHYCMEGGLETLNEDAGCPDGTTIVIRDIFYNTPARMKFLKKDVSEANAAAAVIDRIALSHPEISFKLIRDGKQTLNTSGDGKIESAVYSVLGREFAGTMIPVDSELDRIKVIGLTCKPVACRSTRGGQYIFLNGRLVRSGTVTAASEQAYKNSMMVGKFPGFVLYLTVPFDTVDVNVHPAKTEVRFSDERRIFDAVYHSVKNALNKGDTRPEITFKHNVFNPYERLKTEQFAQQAIKTETIAEQVYSEKPSGLHKPMTSMPSKNMHVLHNSADPEFMKKFSVVGADGREKKSSAQDTPLQYSETVPYIPKMPTDIDIEKEEKDEPEIIFIGEAFETYIIVQSGSSIFMIDKHAAHERILFNRLKKQQSVEVQSLLAPVNVILPKEEYDAIISGSELLFSSGFEIEDFGNSAVLVRTVPATLIKEDIPLLISELAESLLKNHAAELERLDDLYHTVACKAAIKAGSRTSAEEMRRLAVTVLSSKDIMYCPHGRPVAFEIKRHELERKFGRIQ